MQSTLTLTLDLDTKIGTLTDTTNYISLGLNPVNFGVKAYGLIKFNGTTIQGSGTNWFNPLIDLEAGNTTYQFDLELDVNGEVANGIYSIEGYQIEARYEKQASSGVSGIIIDAQGYNATLYSTPSDIYLLVTGIATFNYGSITGVVDLGGGDVRFIPSVPYPSIPQSLRSIVLKFRTASQSYVYSGCNKITQDIGFSYDCDTDPTGSWSVYSNTPTPSGVNVSAATGTIEWPSWTGEPAITVASLPYSNTALATGTYGATITQVVTQEIQASPLLEVGYALESTYEWKVTCAGSLCEMNACIENLRAAHETELLRNKVSKYQPYIDNVAIYLHEADNYKSCAQFDKYRETLAKVKATLDASGCDCGCCDDNEYKWVAVSPATSTFINNIMSEIQFRVGTTANRPSSINVASGNGLKVGAIYHSTTDNNLYRISFININGTITWDQYYDPTITSITTATNGLTESPAGTVKLGGGLTSSTTISLANYDLTIESVNGETYIKKDASPNAVAYPLVISAQSSGTTNGAGSGLYFATQDQSNADIISSRILSSWTAYSTESQLIFSVKNNNAFFDGFKISGSDKSLTAKGYGLGNLIDNNPEYFLGVDNAGNFIEINPNNVVSTASNGLTKTNGEVKLGGPLTQNTSITTNEQIGYKFTISDLSFGSWPMPFIINDNGANNWGIFMVYTRSGLGVATTGVYYNNIPGKDYSYNIYVYPDEYNSVDPEEGTPQFKVYGDSAAQKGKIQITRYGDGIITGTPTKMLAVDSFGVVIEETVSNGLTLSGSTLKLGGELTGPTTISSISNTNTLTLSGIASVTGTADKLLAVTSAGKIVTTSATNADKIYVARINQTGTANPTADVVVNTLGVGVTPTFLYGGSAGESSMTISGVDFNKACVTFTPGYIGTKDYGVVITYAINPMDPSIIRIYTYDPAGGLQNDLLKNALIKVEFYS